MWKRITRRISGTTIVMWLIGLAILAVVVVGSILTLSSGKYGASEWLELTINGLALGGIYAVIALGYTLVYGILRMINFAHGDIFMAGPFAAYFVAVAFDNANFFGGNAALEVVALTVIMLFAMLVSTVLAVLLERIAYRPLRNSPRLVPLITAIGASFFLQYTFRGLYGSGFQAYPTVKILEGQWMLGDFRILKFQAVVILAAALMMAALYAFVQKSRMGKAIRAVSEDKEAASLMGIGIDRMIVTTFVIGGISAGAAGVLYALMFKQVHFFMGFIPGIKAFTAAVLGGIGNIPGAMLGGIFLGLVESVGPSLFLDGLGIVAPYQLKDAIAFTMLVLVLIFRPTGLLGERLAVKKA